ncbi:glycosyltransferase family 4 protein [Bifidobacterium cebidarum]|uniref:Glycosyltransferase n=1 Tax=Bifidobacterium cebidarum TaxID=2650773 RepID=A0A6I1GCP9_9BIFI|nr:glycosyltransferase family 1 protein [Bifidobacterium cebidarum]KAB7789410.1 glycosyltransferase [Bifidobacterium cebidarum]
MTEQLGHNIVDDPIALPSTNLIKDGRRPLSVLVVSESSLEQTNGVSGSVKHILERFAERGFSAHVIAPQPAPSNGTYAGFEVDEVPTVPIQKFNVAISPKTPIIQSIEDGPKPDIIHIAAPISKLGHAALIAGEELGVPTVAIYQTDVAQYARRFARQAVDGVAPHHTGWLRKVSKAAGDKAEGIVAKRIAQMHNMATLTLAPTNQAKQHLESFGVKPSLIQLWGRGVDSTLFNPSRATNAQATQLHRAWSHDGTMPVIGYVGRLAPEKQVEQLAALNDLNVQLVVVGAGPMEDELHQRLPDAVFTGMLHGDDLADAYAALGIFVHTGNEETFGQTIQEAMASGLPVIAPASGGPIDLVESNVTGLLYKPNDADDLRACVTRLIEDASLRRLMGTNGLAAVQGRTWPMMVDRLIDYYRLAMDLNLARRA